MRFRPSLIAVMSATMLTVAFSPWLLAQGRVPMAEGIWKKLDPSGKPEAEFRIILAAEKITLWDSWLRRDSLNAFGRAFGKPLSLFIANWPVFVWTGRALQAESDDLEKLVLRFCIRPIEGAFELLAIMDIRARSISFTSRPRRPYGPPDHERAGETFLHLLFPTRRPRWESQLNNCFGGEP